MINHKYFSSGKQAVQSLKNKMKQNEIKILNEKQTKKQEYIQKNSEQYHESVNRQRQTIIQQGYQSINLIYDLKKEVLDKLDLILQKINLEIISVMEISNVKEFKLISLNDLQNEIQQLFSKLDECVANRQKSFKMYDNSITYSNGALARQNQILRGQLRQLSHYIQQLQQNQKKQQKVGSINELKQQVYHLTAQIQSYQKLLNQQKFNLRNIDQEIIKKIYMQLEKISIESAKIKQMGSTIKKILKQQSDYIFNFKNQLQEKIGQVIGQKKTKQSKYLSLITQNNLLKEQIKNWEFDIQNYVQQKLVSIYQQSIQQS